MRPAKPRIFGGHHGIVAPGRALDFQIGETNFLRRRLKPQTVSMSFTLEHVAMKKGTRLDTFDLDNLLHPVKAFAHPSQVVADPDLTLNEKRAILASWASDACAVEASPALREGSEGTAVKYDEIMDALRTLDGQIVDQAKYRKLFRRAELFKKIAGDRHGGNVPLQ